MVGYNYEIGAKYVYPNNKKQYILEKVNEQRSVFYFNCGHWCTDNVFMDMINVKTKLQVYKGLQLKLFNYA